MSAERTDPAKKPKRKMALLPKLRIAALVIAGLLVIFVASKNWEPATVDLVLMESKLPIAVLIILTFLFGTAVGVLLAYLRPWTKKRH